MDGHIERMHLCIDYTAYVNNVSKDIVRRTIEEIEVTAKKMRNKGIVFDGKVLKGILEKDAVSMGLTRSGRGWSVPGWKVPMVRYYVATGIVGSISPMAMVDDKTFIGDILKKMAKVGLLYASEKEVGREVFNDVFDLDARGDKKVIPSPMIYKSLVLYVMSKRADVTFFPPQIYTEVMELAGRAKREDGILLHDYRDRAGNGMVVLVGCKGDRLTKAVRLKGYPNAKIVDHEKYNTTIIKYYRDVD